jgi:predicted CoA-binding protein
MVRAAAGRTASTLSRVTRLAGAESGTLSLLARDLLLRNRRISMVGLSANISRPSYRAAVHMVAYGYDVVPVNPMVDVVLGQRAVPSLAEVEGPLGIVDVFRRIEEVPAVVEEALEIGCAAVWLQLGLISPEAEEMCRDAGVPFVQDRCVKMEHCRWFGGLNWVGLATGVISSRREESHRAG